MIIKTSMPNVKNIEKLKTFLALLDLGLIIKEKILKHKRKNKINANIEINKTLVKVFKIK